MLLCCYAGVASTWQAFSGVVCIIPFGSAFCIVVAFLVRIAMLEDQGGGCFKLWSSFVVMPVFLEYDPLTGLVHLNFYCPLCFWLLFNVAVRTASIS